MLRVICNRCDAVIGNILKSAKRPGSTFTPFLFDESTKRLGGHLDDMDLCEKCARELTQALIGWLPALAEIQKKWNADLEEIASALRARK